QTPYSETPRNDRQKTILPDDTDRRDRHAKTYF
ncbi:MAG: hypothetical protein ACI96M_004520, partial [Candidatus Azotimanducaceae bacterium]